MSASTSFAAPAAVHRIALTQARVFDSSTGTVTAAGTIVIEDDQIVDVLPDPDAVIGDAQVIALAGRTVLPGLIDAHVHVTVTQVDILKLSATPPSLITAQSKDILEGMLARGFTTVRDAAGADWGLVQAVERGHFRGPRIFPAGHALSQTGGHGDIRPIGASRLMCPCEGVGILGTIADGVSQVRRAAREQIRNGATQIKIMAGGGVASPTDPIDGTQYSMDELRAICEEAQAANLYTMAHAYSPHAITRAIQAGVRSIEHGNLLDRASAEVMREHGAFLVPTLATYAALSDEGQRLGWLPLQLDKLALVADAGLNAIRVARDVGVQVGFGTDLLGAMHAQQCREFGLRAQVMSAAEVLQSATIVNAKLMGLQGKAGVVAPGAWADLLVVDGDPTEDIGLMQDPARSLMLIIKAGRIVRNALGRAGR